MAEEVDFYLGTYTRDGGSEGIYHAKLDRATGAMTKVELAAKIGSPSFLAVHPDGKKLYAVHEGGQGAVSGFAIETSGKLKLLNTESVHGNGPCHLCLDPKGKVVLTSCYGDGVVTCLPVKADGTLAAASTIFKNEGSGPDKGRQEGPHGHAIYTDASGKFAYGCDLGTDEVLVFHLNVDKGELKLAEPRAAKVPPGGGPRHLALHPSGKFAYVNNEMTLSISAFTRNEKTGALTLGETLSTLPADDSSTKSRSTAEIHCHPSGKFVYVSNRGHETIAVYAIDDAGKLKLVEIAPAGVKEPRGFGIDPKGEWMVVGGQNSDDVVSLKIDPQTGKLKASGHKIACYAPVCVVFVGK